MVWVLGVDSKVYGGVAELKWWIGSSREVWEWLKRGQSTGFGCCLGCLVRQR